uniref:Uncharacterized protein n=1 Tax=Timema poppense TaxID=170557 RepID=A0A7R9DXA0_TIMPO|nr:unnamed protein product [Timema poppensis]
MAVGGGGSEGKNKRKTEILVEERDQRSKMTKSYRTESCRGRTTPPNNRGGKYNGLGPGKSEIPRSEIGVQEMEGAGKITHKNADVNALSRESWVIRIKGLATTWRNRDIVDKQRIEKRGKEITLGKNVTSGR